MDITLTPAQEKVGHEVRQWYDTPMSQVFYLAGYAGTGKTTIVPNILDMCNVKPHSVAFCAPTGKAAQVLTKKLKGFFGKGVQAKTIHSWIYTPRRMKVEDLHEQLDVIKTQLKRIEEGQAITHMNFKDLPVERIEALLEITETDLEKAYNNEDGPSFTLNIESKIKGTELIVVDESSMVGTEVARDLKSFGIPILAIGDPMQLQPVKDKRGLAVGDPNAFLEEIHRQAADNPIIDLATRIRQGKHVGYGSMGDAVRIIKRKDDDVTLNVDRDAQVIVGTNSTRYQLTGAIRKALNFEGPVPNKDEPLMIVKNSRNSPALVNGSQVWCDEAPAAFDDGDAAFPIKFSDDDGVQYSVNALQKFFEHHVGKSTKSFSADVFDIMRAQKNGAESLDFAWAITGHKSQGSQWPEVVVRDESGCFREEAINWLYTVVTRAEEKLTIVR